MRWALAAVWLWRDARAEAMPVTSTEIMVNDLDPRHSDRALARASADLRARVWQCSSDWLRDDAPRAATLDDHRVREALARHLRCAGRLPRWAEQALRAMYDRRRNHVIGDILDRKVWWTWQEQAAVARYLRSLGWSGEHESVALAEAAVDHRPPSRDIARILLRWSGD